MRFSSQVVACLAVVGGVAASNEDNKTTSVQRKLQASTGGGAPGADCSNDSDCASGRCDRAGWYYICHETVGDGEACNENSDCSSGRCDFASNWSLSKVCFSTVALGEACNEDSDCKSGKCGGDTAFAFTHECIDPMCGGAHGMISQTVAVPLIAAFGDVHESTHNILTEMSPGTLAVTRAVPESLISLGPGVHTDITTEGVSLGWTKPEGAGFSGPWEEDELELEVTEITDSFSVTELPEDDFFGPLSLSFAMGGDFLLNSGFEVIDSTVYFEDETFDEVMEDLRIDQIMPPTYNTDFDMVSDESFSRMFFYGFGVPILAAQEEVSTSENGPFVADMPLHSFATRERYRSLGARVHFDSHQQVTAIYDYENETEYKPGDEGWEAAKFLARITCFTLITAREHLIWTHMLGAQPITVNSQTKLPPSHPIRRLLTIHTYRTSTVNANAFSALVPEGSMLHRAGPFEYEGGLKNIFQYSWDTSNIFEPFKTRRINPALQELVDANRFPFVSQGIAYYELVEEFVREWLNESGDQASDTYAMEFYEGMRASTIGQAYEIPEYSGEQDMIDVLTQAIWIVTAWHELVGYVADLNNPKTGAFARISKECDQTQVDAASFIVAELVCASTSIRMPYLMREFPNYFGSGGAPAWERTVWDSFVNKMGELSTVVQNQDEERISAGHPEFKHMDPARFECAVSV